MSISGGDEVVVDLHRHDVIRSHGSLHKYNGLLLRRFLRRVLLVHWGLGGDFVLLRRRNRDLRPAFFGPVEMEKVSARLISALVRVRAKVIPLRLEQIRRQSLTAIAVV